MQLTCKIERVCYPPETDTTATWFILATDQGTAKGAMPWRPKQNDKLILDGEWSMYQGKREFKFKSAMIDVPVHPKDQLHFVAARTVGMGPALEALIWQQAGENWKTIKAGEVKGLTPRVHAEMLLQIESLETDAEMAKSVAFLMGKGCTQNMAMAAYTLWKADTMGIVIDNPYRLADLPNYGFNHVDGEIRKAFGIGDDDERRIKSAVIYALRRLTDTGSTITDWESLLRHAMGMLGGRADLITNCTKALFESGDLKGFKASGSIALAADYRDELAVWEFVNSEVE